MARNIKKGAALAAGVAAVLAVGTTGGAVAGGLITGAQIKNQTITSADLGPNSVKYSEVADGAVSWPSLTKGAHNMIKSYAGKDGATGPRGPQGPQGKQGDKGDPGKDAQALPYGVAKVQVQRGTNPATAWATYSTTIGGPEGDTTGGTFRFTCNEAQAPCKVSVAAYSTADGVKVYPRLDIQTQSLNGGPQTYCEYADGPLSGTLTNAATEQTINIGGSADCNGPVATPQDVQVITVPAGYYDVASTFLFLRQS